MAADLVLVDGDPSADICLLMSPPPGGAVMNADAVATLTACAAREAGRDQHLRHEEVSALANGVAAACVRAAGGGSSVRLVLREGLAAVVPSLDMLSLNRELYEETSPVKV